MTEDVQIFLETEERWPIVRATFPNWDEVKHEFYKIPEIANVQGTKQQFGSDYYNEDGSTRTALPVWFWNWYNHTERLLGQLALSSLRFTNVVNMPL